jgi:hypothetical protein
MTGGAVQIKDQLQAACEVNYFLDLRIFRSFAMRAFAAAEPFFNGPADFEDFFRALLRVEDFFFVRLRDREREVPRRDALRDPLKTRSIFCTAGLC